MTSPRTLLQVLIQKLRGCLISRDADVDPVAVLWSVPRGEWKPRLFLLRQNLQELFSLGDYDRQQQRGTALWLCCIVDRTQLLADLPQGRIPIV